MGASFPFRCDSCSQLKYAEKVTDHPDCCGNPMQRLTSICLLIPCPEDKEPVHQSTQSELVDHNRKWLLACGKTELPPHYTTYPPACTCKECREYVAEIYEKAGWDIDEEGDLQDFEISLESDTENPPPNPFK